MVSIAASCRGSNRGGWLSNSRHPCFPFGQIQSRLQHIQRLSIWLRLARTSRCVAAATDHKNQNREQNFANRTLRTNSKPFMSHLENEFARLW